MCTESRSGYLSAPALRALALIVAITSFATPALAQRAAGGGAHTLLVGSDGSVWSSGHNMFGQLGDDTTENKTFPIQVPGLSNVVAVAAGEDSRRFRQVDIYVTNDERFLAQTPEMQRETALHEIGHLMGLWHNLKFNFARLSWVSGTNESSIMNGASDATDSKGWEPPSVTPCDSRRAQEAYSRQP